MANDPVIPGDGQLQRFEALAKRLRTAALDATIGRWDTSFYFEVPGFVLAKAPTVHLEMLVAEATHDRDARVIAMYRDVAPIYVSEIESVIATGRNPSPRPITSLFVEQVMAGVWADRTSRWKWAGWNPATGEARKIPEGPVWRDEWTSPPKTGSVNRGTRVVDVPRNSLVTSSPGLWTLVHEPDRVGAPRVIADRDGKVVAHFRRPEDAVFAVVAREAVSVFGAAVAAVGELLDDHAHGTIDPEVLLDTIAHTTPWPCGALTDTSTAEGLPTL